MSAFEDLRDASPASMRKLNDMLRYLYKKVQGGISRDELAPELVEDIATVDWDKLVDGAITGDKISDGQITGGHIVEASIGSAHIQEAAITNAKIDRVSADKLVVTDVDVANANIKALFAGLIDTTAITVQGTDGKLKLNDNTLTVTDNNNKKRVAVGDVHEDGSVYGLEIFGTDGLTALFNDTGITSDGIPSRTVAYEQLNEYLQNQISFASGRNKVYYQDVEPTGGEYISGDIWFDTNDGYKMYLHDGAIWAAAQFGENAIAANAITADKIRAHTITAASEIVHDLDASVITAGTMSADRIYGGSLILGGVDNGNGFEVIKDSSDNTIVTGNSEGITINQPAPSSYPHDTMIPLKIIFDNGTYTILDISSHISWVLPAYPRAPFASLSSILNFHGALRLYASDSHHITLEPRTNCLSLIIHGDPSSDSIINIVQEDDGVRIFNYTGNISINNVPMNPSGIDECVITGTPGLSGDLLMWNVDGDAIEAALAASAVLKCVNRQNNSANSVVSNQIIKTGWGFLTGNDSSSTPITEAITFDETFDDTPIVLVSAIGAKATSTGAPTSPSFSSTGNNVVSLTYTTPAGFSVRMMSALDYALSSSYYYGYSWIAIGTKAR